MMNDQSISLKTRIDSFDESTKNISRSKNKTIEYSKKFLDKISNIGIDGLKSDFDKNCFYYNTNSSSQDFLKNKDANRFEDIPCIDQTRIILDPLIGGNEEGPELSNYIHANYVEIPELKYKFITTQLPLKSTHNNFWRMIYQENASTIIVFCDEEEISNTEDVPLKLYPNENNENIQLETLYLMNKKNGTTSGFSHSIVEVLPNGCSNSNVVKVIQTNVWPRDSIPNSRLRILRLLRTISEPVCVLVCTSGIGRSGTFMLIAAMKGYISMNKFFDGIELFKIIRNQRAYAIQSHKHYIYAYTVMMEYIKIRTKDTFNEKILELLSRSIKYI
ncbi:Protein-tyrosine phosphatase,receptor/non-receptor type domain and Protein-tyrosine/Dual specificity phosphatase domain and Protein-tyrosine phosphatase, catalytic domain-containing protein [Strongyloides ratti]|uniref:Protein-tyrosine phosphatase,receptor/non-receptor type domain and Protein-tyrosine/Dual specificity phosphatase domain and Protein-tyrosine phosphatase, catalytic domain-containing protein n=1 Tax=Strongyloides ratti TaxID=34506 RepID=A0A090L0H0_STRRB|nr:Protein-tyrosine phosphatase,receptor/non-receptor type domain and Protein-tyrosine/Dual specificity phosphatase domain and Protein-tyrosine phosphatase, catalytic domain-containing protein [Strongyloides ratti]CEF60994.1 Protein-tyrosine phosphatase,receptor/non-receptor type domain and Protein-tyrosine/Dual specificity phosphatase domain and Protein-tyrosine phosphatase, catalytic domain-containing protein [Strongyloides ratti]